MKIILQIAAWLSCISGLTAGLLALTLISELGPWRVTFAVAYLFSGFLVWALLLVIVQIAERLERVENGIHRLGQRPPSTESRSVKSYSVLDRIGS